MNQERFFGEHLKGFILRRLTLDNCGQSRKKPTKYTKTTFWATLPAVSGVAAPANITSRSVRASISNKPPSTGFNEVSIQTVVAQLLPSKEVHL
jgi:hypothetical protein